MRRNRLVVIAVIAVAIAATAAGCGGGKSASSTGTSTDVTVTPGQTKASIYNDPSQLVLAEADLPNGYIVDAPNTRSVTNADASRGRPASYKQTLESFGRIIGYASGWKPGSVSVQGPLQIQSSASTFETDGGAEDAFALGLKEVDSRYSKVEMAKTIGDESRMYSINLSSGTTQLIQFAVAWRSGRVLATIAVTAEQDTISAGEAEAYAHKQQQRIDAVLKAAK
jgi:hypothetical protein